jgi:hypothetical protein
MCQFKQPYSRRLTSFKSFIDKQRRQFWDEYDDNSKPVTKFQTLFDNGNDFDESAKETIRKKMQT